VRRLLKFLHEIGTVGLMGAAATQLVLTYRGDGLGPQQLALLRSVIVEITEWVLLPSLLVVLASGLFAMAMHDPYIRAPWALIKAALTVLVLEGTLFSVQGPAQTAAQITAEIAAGDLTHASALPNVLRHERGGLWVLMFLCVVNVALAVWRPKFRRRKKKPPSH